jgi:hypothetical protein
MLHVLSFHLKAQQTATYQALQRFRIFSELSRNSTTHSVCRRWAVVFGNTGGDERLAVRCWADVWRDLSRDAEALAWDRFFLVNLKDRNWAYQCFGS